MAELLTSIEACIPALRRYASALLRSRQDADDLVHDTLLRALDRLHTKRDHADVRPWLFAIMHNVFISQKRRASIAPEDPWQDDAGEAAGLPQGTQEDGLRRRDLIRQLRSLPQAQRSVVLLVSVEDLSYAEAARVLDIPIGTVMSRLARGRERLRAMVQAGVTTRPCLRRVK